jgi:hypothetical protein
LQSLGIKKMRDWIEPETRENDAVITKELAWKNTTIKTISTRFLILLRGS